MLILGFSPAYFLSRRAIFFPLRKRIDFSHLTRRGSRRGLARVVGPPLFRPLGTERDKE
jgi:hypothetical protein